MAYSGLGDARSDAGLTPWTDAMRARVYAWLTPAQQTAVAAAGAQVYLPDPSIMAVADGLIPATQAGSDASQVVHNQVTRGPATFAQAIIATPALAGLWVSWLAINAARDAISQGFFSGWDALYLNLTTPGLPTNSGLEIPPGITEAQASPYLAAIAKYFPEMANAYKIATANPDDRLVPKDFMALTFARNAAMAAGTVTVNNDSRFTPYKIPSAFVDEGPIELPDGNVFVVAEGDASFSPATRNVYIWHGPNWKPAKVSYPDTGSIDPTNLAAAAANRAGRNPWYHVMRTNDLIQMPDPGTDSWYIAGAMGQTDLDGTPLWVPPVGWNQGYKLSQVVHEMYGMVPRVNWSATRDAQGAVIPPTWIDAGASGTFLPVAQAGDVAQPAPNYAAQPWTPPKTRGGQWTAPTAPGGASGPGIPMPSVTLPTTPVTFVPTTVLDQGGNVVPAPIVEVHTLPVQSPSGPIQAVSPMSPLLVVGALAAVVFFLSKQK